MHNRYATMFVKMVMHMKKKNTLILGISLATTIVSGALLSSGYVSADDVVDEINITVPMSCTMSGTGMDTHNANIKNIYNI